MWGKDINAPRRIGLLVALGGSGIILACFVLVTHRWFSTTPSADELLGETPAAPAESPKPPTAVPPAAVSPSPTVSAKSKIDSSAIASPPSTSGVASTNAASTNRQGILRISNPTEYPIRVVLLAKRSQATPPSAAEKSSTYELPAHWDFAPQEGSTKGLVVSLPNRNLRVKKR
ncbi:hypothetical protein [Leptothermofonsia sp. ETS-13]|uniref:hypothetical protein n=1 Tax=Leptothermofonsia sp. ETS-13 TaxID=3035696 RepID=UPI003B9EB46A